MNETTDWRKVFEIERDRLKLIIKRDSYSMEYHQNMVAMYHDKLRVVRAELHKIEKDLRDMDVQ